MDPKPKIKFTTLDLTRELREKILFETLRRDIYFLAVNVLRELKVLTEKYGAWRKKYSRLLK